MRAHGEAGFTLLEVLVAVAIVTLIGGTTGTFFLGGPQPVAALAARDMSAAVDEARQAAHAFDRATIVIAADAAGAGYTARIYAGRPGDALFQVQNGPGYHSIAQLDEIGAALGAPGLAFAFDGAGTVTGFAAFAPAVPNPVAAACPAGGAFVLAFRYERERQTLAIPCSPARSEATPVAAVTAAPGWTPGPPPDRSCQAPAGCAIAALPLPAVAGCPGGTFADAAAPGLCVPPALPSAAPATPQPVRAPTPCPQAFSGAAPACAAQIIEIYQAAADLSPAHATTLFADGGFCDDGGCSMLGAVEWTWGCAPQARAGSNGLNGANAAYFRADNQYAASADAAIAAAFHDAAETGGNGAVATSDSYCTGLAAPQP